MSVDTLHPQYLAMLPEWAKMHDVNTSERVIHLKGETYLPRLSEMTDSEYEAYTKRASFVTFTKRTIEAFVGMVMRKKVETDGDIEANVDGKGGDIDSYTNEVLSEYLVYGRCATLVDLPLADDAITVADEINQNIKPKLHLYGATSIINWKTEIVNNVETLSMVVLRETVNTSDDEFGHDEQFRYRVLDLNDGIYRQRVYDHNHNQVGGEIIPKSNNRELKFIPIVIHGGVDVDYPLLLSVADQNIHHYVADAGYQHGIHFIGLPTPYTVGVDPEDKNAPKTIGPTKLWNLPDGASCGMLEFIGQGMGEVARNLDRIVDTIVILASRILAPEKSSNDESALAAAIRNNAETSTLAGVTRHLSKELEEVLKIAAWWGNGDPNGVKVKINSDFMPMTLSGTDMLSYVTAWIKGGISYESLFHVLKRGEIVEGDRKEFEELADITKEQKERLAFEVDKAEQLGKVENSSEDDELIPDTDVEIKQDFKLK